MIRRHRRAGQKPSRFVVAMGELICDRAERGEFEPMTQRVIANACGVSHRAVQMAERDALRSMAQRLEKDYREGVLG